MKNILFVAMLAFISSCEPKQGKRIEGKLIEKPRTMANVSRKIVVEEVIQANKYTYLKAREGDKSIWMAIPKRELEVGKTYYYGQAMEMKNFQSKDLNRTFKSVYFLSGLSDSPSGNSSMQDKSREKPIFEKNESERKMDLNIETEEGISTLSNLYENKENLQSKAIKVKGLVTKFNAKIMGKNWVHIQDGTGGEVNFDLTITTQEHVNVGDIVTFEGKVTLDKDFGYGYKYDLLLEEGVLINKEVNI